MIYFFLSLFFFGFFFSLSLPLPCSLFAMVDSFPVKISWTKITSAR
ncbi:hypothetical protein ANAEL_03196 [Anaerolineales bacterium]|nr:hypothetical protein ANAEL_03196 [Anaerolineales bacterium]